MHSDPIPTKPGRELPKNRNDFLANPPSDLCIIDPVECMSRSIGKALFDPFVLILSHESKVVPNHGREQVLFGL